ncbi:WD40 repeat protein [Streptosporangium becharense]|uniref:WD40 repeat protein n=1 Tax=Streptosporangium becharense TaxID=1816182 RepID=A0A7W9IKN1_9ACTN|nr:protein kinase family protein [Streptosporangium becharense]MBB2911113.1 WD40 repeat protein [Streptosporangium becharense]MBB5821829.1 WD40 repeat protein [Streptosporangium becharense]
MRGEVASWPLPPGRPDRLGEYRLLGLLEEDGRGSVYLAESAAGVRVALTVVNVRLPQGRQVRGRFVREVEAVRGVVVPGVAGVVSAAVVEGVPVVAGELVGGESLGQVVTRGGPLRGEMLVRVAAETVAALAGLHAAGVVHGSFGPDRVLLGPDGVRVTGVWVARALGAAGVGGPVGVAGFVAPEQVAGFVAGPAGDVFGWAATVVFAATGVMFSGGSGPDLSGVPEPLRGWLPACLDGDPGRRPSANEVMFALSRAVHGHPGQAVHGLPGPAAHPPFGPAGGSGMVQGAPFAPQGASFGPRDGLVTHPSAGPQGRPAVQSPFTPQAAAPRRSRWPWAAGVAGVLVLVLSATVAVNLLNGEEAAEGTRQNVTAGTAAALAVPPSTAPASPGSDFGTPLWTATLSDPWVQSVTIAEAGGVPIVAAAGDEGTVDLLRLDTGKAAVSPIKAHKGKIYDLAVTAHGGRSVLLSGSEDKTVRRWDLATGDPVGQPVKSDYEVFTIGALDLGGRKIAAVESGGDWLLELDGSDLASLPITPSRCAGPSAFGTLDDRLVKVCPDADSAVGVWDVRTDERIGAAGWGSGKPVLDLALGTVGGQPVIVTGCEDGIVRRWDLATGNPLRGPIVGHESTVSGVAVTRLAGRPVIVSYSNHPDSTIRVWDWETGVPVGTPIRLEITGTSMAVAEVGGMVTVVLGSTDGKLSAWKLGTP